MPTFIFIYIKIHVGIYYNLYYYTNPQKIDIFLNFATYHKKICKYFYLTSSIELSSSSGMNCCVTTDAQTVAKSSTIEISAPTSKSESL